MERWWYRRSGRCPAHGPRVSCLVPGPRPWSGSSVIEMWANVLRTNSPGWFSLTLRQRVTVGRWMLLRRRRRRWRRDVCVTEATDPAARAPQNQRVFGVFKTMSSVFGFIHSRLTHKSRIKPVDGAARTLIHPQITDRVCGSIPRRVSVWTVGEKTTPCSNVLVEF